MRYKFFIPRAGKMYPCVIEAQDSPNLLAQQHALSQYNALRRTERIGPLSMLPSGTKKTTIAFSSMPDVSALYIPGSMSIIDLVRDGKPVYSNISLQDLIAKNPGAKVVPEQEAYAEVRRAESEFYLSQDPVEIDEEKYDDMLNCLPPMNWVCGDMQSSFQMSEMLRGCFTDAYIRYKMKVGDEPRYFTFPVVAGTPHNQIIARLLDFLNK